MPATRMAHFSISTPDLEASKNFYTDVLGFRVGYRPPFDFAGYWIYLAEEPVVHMFGEDGKVTSAAEPGAQSYGSGAVDHIAFHAEDLPSTLHALNSRGIAFSERAVPASRLHQVFVRDPSGVTIELNFDIPAAEQP